MTLSGQGGEEACMEGGRQFERKMVYTLCKEKLILNSLSAESEALDIQKGA